LTSSTANRRPTMKIQIGTGTSLV